MSKKPETLKPFYVGPRKTQRSKAELKKLPAMASWTLSLDIPVIQWLEDRATILGVRPAQLARDIIALYANLVREEESKMHIDYGQVQTTPLLRERNEGYIQRLTPHGVRPTHLDDSPMGIAEL